MQQFTVDDVRRNRTRSDAPYLEFLRVSSMSAGLYELPAGGVDAQQPHTEDELYYIVSGKATLLVGEQDVPVATGSMIFVPARVVHRFHTITEALSILVFFAPAEYANADSPQP